MEDQNTTAEIVQENASSQLNQVTPFSKYLAMVLFIILPFVGGYVGYTFAPEKVVEVEKTVIKEVEVVSEITSPTEDQLVGEQEANVGNETISSDLAKYLETAHFVQYNGVSASKDYFAFIPRDEAVLKVINLEENTLFKSVSPEQLTFLNFGYDRLYTEMLPSDYGDAIFIDMADACACELANEAIVILRNNQVRMLPLPSVTEFEWIDGINLTYRYKEVLPDPDKCAGVDGICIGVKTADEWTEGKIDLNADNLLNVWDGRRFN